MVTPSVPFPTIDEQVRAVGWITTYTGLTVTPTAMEPQMLNIYDIAHSLANTVRFNGHARQFGYSVAQHCCTVAHKVDLELALTALLHDAAEAYLGDLVRPVKMLPEFAFFRELEASIDRVVAQRFGTIYPFPEEVIAAGDAVLVDEFAQFFYGTERPWTPEEAEFRFLTFFDLLQPR